MDGLKEPKYLNGLKNTTTTFTFQITNNGGYSIDYSSGRNAAITVVEKLKELVNDLNKTSEDVKTMLSAYVLSDTVDINSFVNAVNGGMNSMASQMSTTIQEILTEATERMDKAENTDKQLVENLNKPTSEMGDTSNPSGSNPGGGATPPNTNEANPNGYSGSVATKSQATDGCDSTAGKVTTNNQKYTVVPDGEYTGAPGTISATDYKYLVAQVAGESGNSKDDMLGVASTIMNRLEAGGGYGNSVVQVLEKGYWPWGRTCDHYVENGDYYNTDWGQEKLAQVNEVINDVLNGTRNLNSDVYYYSGDGTRNYFSDVL